MWNTASAKVIENNAVNIAASKLRTVALDKITTPVQEYTKYRQRYNCIKQHFL